MILNRDSILKASDRNAELVSVPEWGGDVLVGVMSGSDRDAWEFSMVNARKSAEKAGKLFTFENLRATLVALTVVDESGKRIFTTSDVEALGQKSAAALDRIYEVATKLNKLTKEDQEELVKNS